MNTIGIVAVAAFAARRGRYHGFAPIEQSADGRVQRLGSLQHVREVFECRTTRA